MLQLCRWLTVRFRLDPRNEGDIMHHGKQMDTFNCGPAMANTISHYLFKKPLWTPDRAILERVQWFLNIFHAMSPPAAENPISPSIDTDSMDIHQQVKKLQAEDLNVSHEISSSSNQLVDEDEGLSQMPALGILDPQFRHSYRTRANGNPTANEENLASKSRLLNDVTPTNDGLADHLFGVSDVLKELHLRIKVLEDGVDLLAKLTTEWLGARSEVQQEVNRRLEAESELLLLGREMEALEKERSKAFFRAQYLGEALQSLRAAQSEVQQLNRQDQGFEADLEMSQLLRKIQSLIRERDQALEEGHRLRGLAQEARGLKPFGWGVPSDLWPVQHHGRAEDVSNRHRHSPIGAQPKAQGENPSRMTSLTKTLTIRREMFDQEANRRAELESEVIVLRSGLGGFLPLVAALHSYSELRKDQSIFPLVVGIHDFRPGNPDDSLRTPRCRGLSQAQH